MTDTIYQRPEDYDLEHESDERDVAFYRELCRRLAPARLLELACGSGRLTVPLAQLGAERGFEVTGVDTGEEMLDEARRKVAEAGDAVAGRVTLAHGDMRTWESSEPFDVVLIACSSISHLLTLDDQLAVWRRAHALLRPGGRFIIDITMPNLRAYAESLQTPPRALLEVDVDATDDQGRRLIRYKTTRFDPFTQRAQIHFFYDTFRNDSASDRYVSDFESHVYFPRELELLFRFTGFHVDAVWADYGFRAPQPWSRELVMVASRTA